MLTNSVTYQDMGKAETMYLWERSNRSYKATKLIVGDSVANQLYEYYGNEKYTVLTGNLAMTPVWQYIFVRDYIEANPQTTEVYLCLVADSFERGFEINTSYSYMLVPLVKSNNMDVLEEPQKKNLENMFGKIFVKKQVVDFIGNSGLNSKLYLNAVKKIYENFSQKKIQVERKGNPDLQLAETYIAKIAELCKEKNVSLYLLPNPKMDTAENRGYLEKLKEKYTESKLYEINPDYFEQIVFFPQEYFKDELHFKDEFLKDGGKNFIIEEIQKNTGRLGALIK